MSVDDKRLLATAYHEAGHAVAARRLGQGVTGISIVPDSESRGRTTGHKRSIDASRRFFAQLEEADYDAGWGGSIKGRLRRRVERTVMVLLAGGMAEMRATGAGLSDVGVGVEKVSEERARELANKGLGNVKFEMSSGDYTVAFDLVKEASSSVEEAEAYLAWLTARTESLMAKPGY